MGQSRRGYKGRQGLAIVFGKRDIDLSAAPRVHPSRLADQQRRAALPIAFAIA
jgi:hypothetical protein